MAIRTPEEIQKKKKELETERDMFQKFMRDIYNDKKMEDRINVHLWRINREISILAWVTDDDLPF